MVLELPRVNSFTRIELLVKNKMFSAHVSFKFHAKPK